MGITNTISELSNYFYQWHKNKYDEIHNVTVATQQTIYETIFGQGGIQETLNALVLNFNNLLNRYNTLTSGSSSTIHNLETSISSNSTKITNLENNKIDKNKAIQKETTNACWSYVEIAHDDPSFYACSLRYNDYLGIGIFYCDIDANDGRAKRSVNKYGYTDWIEFSSVLNKYGRNKYNTHIINAGRTPSATFSTLGVNGNTKIRFAPEGKIYAAFRETTAVNDKYGVLEARFVMIYYYGPKK